MHAIISVVVKDLDKDGNIVDVMMKETSVGRVIVNQIVPEEVGYLNTIISKKSLRDIISEVIKKVGVARACEFLDGIKNLGYRMSFRGGLSVLLLFLLFCWDYKQLFLCSWWRSFWRTILVVVYCLLFLALTTSLIAVVIVAIEATTDRKSVV